MKRLLFVLYLFIPSVLAAQTYTIQIVVDIKDLDPSELRMKLPDSNFTTSIRDTVIRGEILEICNGSYAHPAGFVLGVLKVKSSKSDTIYQIVVQKNNQIEGLEIGQQIRAFVKPYHPKDAALNKTTGLACSAITGYNLYQLRKVKRIGKLN